jgi:pimeloyl-ACP methyl ester carboxylesterase
MKKKKKLPFVLRAIRWTFPKLQKVAPSLAGKWEQRLFFQPYRFPYPKSELALMETAERDVMTFGEHQIQTYSWGQGPIILLMHGWAGRATQFYKFIDPLVDQGYQVVAIDAPAHGKSTGKETNLIEMTDLLLSSVKNFGSIEAVVAHSFGGAVTLHAMENGLQINKLVTISTPSIGELIIEEFRRRINGSKKVGKAIEAKVQKITGNSFDYYSGHQSAKRVVAVPTLIIHDKDDKEAVLDHAFALQNALKGSELFTTEKLGHTKILRDDSVIAKVSAFLQAPVMEHVLLSS